MKTTTIYILALFTFLLSPFSFAAHAQNVYGKYFMQDGMMGNELTIRKNHSFKLRAVNWESGNGAIHYGKWVLKNDTLVLEYKYVRTVKGVGEKRTRTNYKHTKETQSDVLILFKDKLCFTLPADDDCYKKK
ncbi:MAG TPA: hypothetical protein VK796_02870 [Cytophaga sp.]|nr:hypothetical protein [Cytophaga sp.]